jgi:lipopolysaccharide export LptBFGC system permease protein LptF
MSLIPLVIIGVVIALIVAFFVFLFWLWGPGGAKAREEAAQAKAAQQAAHELEVERIKRESGQA